MLSTDAHENESDATGGAMVPIAPTLEWVRRPMVQTRPDPSFVTQLIAQAEHVPQASRLRRATPDDANLAYSRKNLLDSVTARTRQVA